MIEGLEGTCLVERANRFKVSKYNKILGYENVYAVGDVACMETEGYSYGHPMMAQPAIQQGKLLAKNINDCITASDQGFHAKYSSHICHVV